MKEINDKLNQLRIRLSSEEVVDRIRTIGPKFFAAIRSKLGYNVGREVNGLRTLTEEVEFDAQIIEGTAIILNDEVIPGTNTNNPSVSLTENTFDDGWIGDPHRNCDPSWDASSSSKSATSAGQTVTNRQVKEDYMNRIVFNGSPDSYEQALALAGGNTNASNQIKP